MSDRPTPETDAFRNSQFTDRVDEMEKLYDFSEKLERERDEARNSSEAFSALAWKLEGERNEAITKYDNLATEHMLVVNKLCNERDQARNLAEFFHHDQTRLLIENANSETK
jgi:hypothetical protein